MGSISARYFVILFQKQIAEISISSLRIQSRIARSNQMTLITYLNLKSSVPSRSLSVSTFSKRNLACMSCLGLLLLKFPCTFIFRGLFIPAVRFISNYDSFLGRTLMLLACNNKYYLICDKITNFRIFTKLIPIRHFVHPCRLQVQGEFVYILSAQSRQRTCKQTRLVLASYESGQNA